MVMKVSSTSPINNRTLVEAMTNSLSPYHFTATTFRKTHTTMVMAIHTAGLTWLESNQ